MWRFNPIYKTTIWGGDRIASFKGLETDLRSIGESWELSGVENDESVVAEGPDIGLTISQLIDKYGSSLLGERNYKRFGDRFPLLIKYIDARADLSVQVHPNDDLACKRGNICGKTEMWYVLDADKGARLANGFKAKVNPADYHRLVESGEIMDMLNFLTIHAGDSFFIPAGRVHTIGAGSFIVEIQQSSDITYRLYDYHRKDAHGKERELHTDLAFEAINFNDTEGHAVKYTSRPDIPVNLVSSPFFTINKLQLDEKILRDYSEADTFVILIVTEGKATFTCGKDTMTVKQGMTVLVPASCRGLSIEPEGKFIALETYIK